MTGESAPLRAPGADELLAAWERGQALWPGHPGRIDEVLRALGVEDPGGRPLGGRNRLLLAGRALLFGARAELVAHCPACGEELEAEVSVVDLLERAPGAEDAGTAVRIDGYDVRLRLPTGADLAGLPGEVDAATALLLERCVLSARRAGEPVAAAELPPDVVDAVDRALAEADPASELGLTVICPACAGTSRLALDPAALLWEELDAWAWRLLAEVHGLATAYGWSEAEVLRLSPARRQAYLHLCGAGAA
ncbi:hypothetical protein E8D34_04935 [Nocardioides sp. GY 10113]|uniref:hypothetical protein n=1 Tax=Nocardioides sp. GY 10113 TaxID=2569761 RepID=UPI0010A8AF9A|nr:hypothetical protein [Nocardioides sp. GY 10113]TIC88288.1 hypothetical protein E8D34_04935 [Nocardioides sp. GY 10113]